MFECGIVMDSQCKCLQEWPCQGLSPEQPDLVNLEKSKVTSRPGSFCGASWGFGV